LLGSSPELSADDRSRLRPGGLLYTYLTERSYRGGVTGRDLRRRRGIRFEVLDDAAIAALDPVLAGRFHRATYVPDVLHIHDPMAFTVLLGRIFAEHGGTLVHAEATRPVIERGVVRAVATDEGRLVGDVVVVAAGAWSTLFARHLGLRVPLDTERGYGVNLPRSGIDLRMPILSEDHHFALVPAGDGALRLAGTDELAGLDAAPDFRRAERLIAAARTVFPELQTLGATQWMSYRPSMPDSLPVIGRVPHHANAYVAFGHGHVGLTLAAITGRLITELVDGRTPSIDLTPYRPTRFSLSDLALSVVRT
jgi:D-amino-acid dehydrogenase